MIRVPVPPGEMRVGYVLLCMNPLENINNRKAVEKAREAGLEARNLAT
jgi:hypothetical protein